MKLIVVITILFSSLLLPISAFAQNGTCRTTSNGFVDWKTCLEGNQPPATKVSITTPVFINNAYQTFFDNERGRCSQINSLTGGNQNPNIKDCEALATSVTINAFALDVFSVILAIMFLIFCILIFRSRIMYITAGDNEEQVKKSKKMATAAFIGFLMIFLGLMIGQILALSIGSNIFEFKLFG